MASPQPQAIALSGDIRPGDVHPIHLNGNEFALWRGDDEVVHLWEDRCPHRGMRLSFGFVRENRLKCLYHGWEFAAEGNCRKIPAHPDLDPPATLCTNTLAVFENFGMIFVGTNTEHLAQSNCRWHSVRSLFLDCPQVDGLQILHDCMKMSSNDSGSVSLSNDQMFAGASHRCNDRQCALHLSTRHDSQRIRLDAAKQLVNLRNYALSTSAS